MLVRYAERFLAELKSLATSVVAVENGYRGSICVGVTPFIPPGRLVGAISSVERLGFNYRFLLSTGSTDVLLEQLMRQEHGLSFVEFPPGIRFQHHDALNGCPSSAAVIRPQRSWK
jgi:DNA-binding transcriptional LysR family regulator